MTFITTLCQDSDEPLDRSHINACNRSATLRFYQGDHLVTELSPATQVSLLRHGGLPLAQGDADSASTLLGTDQQHSILHTHNRQGSGSIAYSPFGQQPMEGNPVSRLSFNGEPPDLLSGHYLLGNGHRAFNPVLMRFHGPDSLSPFGRGGLNAYAYCQNDPVNYTDPSGQTPFAFTFLKDLARAPKVAQTMFTQNPNPSSAHQSEIRTKLLADLSQREHRSIFGNRALMIGNNINSHPGSDLAPNVADGYSRNDQITAMGEQSVNSAHLNQSREWWKKRMYDSAQLEHTGLPENKRDVLRHGRAEATIATMSHIVAGLASVDSALDRKTGKALRQQ